ncbi:MAG: long-chain fatty acid--CoA ligase [Betaproteobacteria bacterium]
MERLHYRYWPADLPHELDLPRTSLSYNLEVTAHRYPDKPIAIFYDSPLTYGAAWREVLELAGFLRNRCDVERGDRVLLFMQNSPQFIVSYYAILRADAVVVPVNPMNLSEELKHYVADADATTAIVGQELYAQVKPLLGAGGLAHVVVAAYSDYITNPTDLKLPDACSAPRQAIADAGVTLWRDALAEQLAPGATVAGPDDLCVMPYTSGTTGLPKGCIHTHGTVMNTTVAGALWFHMIPDTVILCSLPYFHVTGMQGSMNSPIYGGGTIVLMQRWDRDTAAKLIERYRVEAWTNISTMAIDFLSNPHLDRYDLSSLRRIGGGGAAMPEAVAQKLKDVIGIDYIEGYGLSETIAPTHINPPQRPKKQCLGIPICGTDARVVNPDTLAELGPNEVGEIVSAGGQIFKGYWKNPEATDAAFFERDGKRFFRTGDLGRYDEDGYFFLVDRLKRMINAAGYKVWPAEVETILYRHPDVQEACIVGTPDANRGETVKAFIVLKAGRAGNASQDDIIAWARDHMAAYKIPRLIEFAEALPKSATGKVQWRLLQEREFAKR